MRIHYGFYIICKKLELNFLFSISYWVMEECFLSVTALD